MRDGHMKPKELWQNNNGHVLKTNLTAESEMCSLAWQLCSSLRTKDVGRNPSEGCDTPILKKSIPSSFWSKCRPEVISKHIAGPMHRKSPTLPLASTLISTEWTYMVVETVPASDLLVHMLVASRTNATLELCSDVNRDRHGNRPKSTWLRKQSLPVSGAQLFDPTHQVHGL